VNRNALEFCAVNAALNGIASAKICGSDVLKKVTGPFDLIISNPPYLVDESRRLYRHGGGEWGCNLGLRIVQEGLTKLAPGGRLLLYTGTPIVEGKDIFYEAIRPILRACRTAFEYEEIDPDVFGEELTREPYRQAERIAVVRLLIGSPKLGRSRNAA
jgi:methylase of polypeptide subunit release factors